MDHESWSKAKVNTLLDLSPSQSLILQLSCAFPTGREWKEKGEALSGMVDSGYRIPCLYCEVDAGTAA